MGLLIRTLAKVILSHPFSWCATQTFVLKYTSATDPFLANKNALTRKKDCALGHFLPHSEQIMGALSEGGDIRLKLHFEYFRC